MVALGPPGAGSASDTNPASFLSVEASPGGPARRAHGEIFFLLCCNESRGVTTDVLGPVPDQGGAVFDTNNWRLAYAREPVVRAAGPPCRSMARGLGRPLRRSARPQPGAGGALVGGRPMRAVHARCQPDQMAPGPHQLGLR